MLKTLPAAEKTSNKAASFSAPFAFVPRQVTLANSRQQNMKASSETMGNSSIDNIPTVGSIKKKKEKKKARSRDSSPLLLSIAAYLQYKGYTQTLAALQTEVSISELDDTKVHGLDLDTYYKYLETSKCDSKSNKNDSEDLGMLNGVTKEVKEENIVPKEPKIKKKKKRSNDGDVGNIDEQPGNTNELAKSVIVSNEKSTKSQAKEKKITLGSESFDGFSPDKIVTESQLKESERNSKHEKKKKSKVIVVENGGSEASSLEGKSAADISSETLLNEKRLKSEGKKEKNVSSVCLPDRDTEEFDQMDSSKNASKKEISEDNTVGLDKKSTKKRKKLASERIESQPEDNTVNIDKKSSKKRKKMASEGSESQIEGDGRKTIDVSQKEKENDLLENDGHAGKKRKTVNDEIDPKKSQEISPEMKLDVFPDGEKTPKGSDVQGKADLYANGSLGKNGREGSAPTKSTKKQQKGSAEPKTVNSFQRVKIDDVEFADDRLQDNSYWAKGGADSGYGAKAQEVLGQVRGRDFRHEKTKKKRGSYRGGQIDLQTHSIKFNYSDEE